MLLRHTTPEIQERSALTINPAKTCQPVGAMYAALGVNSCLPHSHGSQGCYAYHRSALTKHYKEPVMAATSAFTEGASVFGGQANLVQAVHNIFTVYNPDVIAVHTTCLSETIGDDIPQIIAKAKADGKIPKGKAVFHANTPSYVGSHVTGYENTVKAMVDYFSEPGPAGSANRINLIPGFVEPSDMAEIRRLATVMGIDSILFPDTTGVLNGPLTGKFRMFPKGGVTIDQLRETGASAATLALGGAATAAARSLDAKCKVGFETLDLPIGLTGTDAYVDALRRISGVPVPAALSVERGQLLDVISDMHQYLYGKRVGLVGDPDQLMALTKFLVSIDMKPVYIVTGTPAGKRWKAEMEAVTAEIDDVKIAVPGDMFLFHQWIKNESVDLIMGNTYLKYIARDEDIPLVRHGFPILDRVGHSYFSTMGYRGGLRLLEKILGAMMDRQDRDAPEKQFELTM